VVLKCKVLDLNHDDMTEGIARKFINAGYQVRKNLEYSFTKYKGEIDVLALDLDNKIAIAIEIKTHHTNKQYLKAIKQLHKHDGVLRDNLGFKVYKIYKLYCSNELERMVL